MMKYGKRKKSCLELYPNKFKVKRQIKKANQNVSMKMRICLLSLQVN